MTLHVPATQPFDPRPTLASLAAHAVPGHEEVDVAAGAVTRLLAADGGLVPVTVRLDGTGAHVSRADGPGAGAPAATDPPSDVASLVRWWLDLDADPARLVRDLGGDGVVGPLVRRRPGVRVVRHPDGFASLVGTVLGQQVSVRAARTVLGRLVATYGTPVRGSDLRAFPTPGVVADVDAGTLRDVLGVPARRAATVQAVARAFRDGLDLAPGVEPADLRARLHAIDGVGPWTVETVLLRAAGDDDAFPAGDLVLRRALGFTTPREAEARAARWSPWRGRAAVHLWVEHVYAPPDGGAVLSAP